MQSSSTILVSKGAASLGQVAQLQVAGGILQNSPTPPSSKTQGGTQGGGNAGAKPGMSIFFLLGVAAVGIVIIFIAIKL